MRDFREAERRLGRGKVSDDGRVGRKWNDGDWGEGMRKIVFACRTAALDHVVKRDGCGGGRWGRWGFGKSGSVEEIGREKADRDPWMARGGGSRSMEGEVEGWWRHNQPERRRPEAAAAAAA